MLSTVRSFFAARNVLEVDCPSLCQGAPIDLHIEVMVLPLKEGAKRYLHTSPEYGMKRLLAEGLTDIYQLSHVFREGEISPLHNPEFTLIEWYRTDLDFETFIQECLELLHLFLGKLPLRSMSYRDVLYEHTGIDYTQATAQMLTHYLYDKGSSLSTAQTWNKDSLLNLIMTYHVEPHLGKEDIVLIYNYPASQSALARVKTTHDGEQVAERFEFYYQGIELGNGYHELTDPVEQKKRLLQAQNDRLAQNKDPLTLDHHLIAALEIGLPDCHGIAVGFDRLMMLRNHCTTLDEVLPFSWELA